jgi:hypothetical protein
MAICSGEVVRTSLAPREYTNVTGIRVDSSRVESRPNGLSYFTIDLPNSDLRIVIC